MASRSSEILAAVYAALTALVLLLAAFYDTDAEVYLFPRIAAVLIALLALMLIYNAFTLSAQASKQNNTQALFDWKALLPGLVVGVVYVLLLEQIGFYICSFVAFLAISMIYGKRSFFDPKAFIYKLVIAAVFIAALYILFWVLLNVRTPAGLLF